MGLRLYAPMKHLIISDRGLLRSSLLLLALGLFNESAPAAPLVPVSQVIRTTVTKQVRYDSELKPYREIELHARVTGYLEALKVDIGDAVKEGQLIASLDVPELKLELSHAEATERRSKAEIERASAAFEEAHVAFTRLQNTDKAQPHLIAPQDLDAARAKSRSAEAALEATREQANVSKADVDKFHTMLAYSQITAPFDGVITKRYLDHGALVQAGSSSGSSPLVRLSQIDRLRLSIPVSLSSVSMIKVGEPLEILVTTTAKHLTGKVSRFTHKVDAATRTMEVEVDLDNQDLSLVPGMYAEASLTLEQHQNALLAPHEAFARTKDGGATIYVVGKDNKIEERSVKLGLETAAGMEVLSGLKEHELVLIGSRTQVTPGETVEPKLIDAPAAAHAVSAR